MLKKAIIYLCLLACAQWINAQSDSIRHWPSLTLGVNALNFNGDVGKQNDENPLRDVKASYSLILEQRFGKVFGIALGGMYGKIAGTDKSKTSNLNFQSDIMQGELALTANFDKVLKRDPKVSPFFSIGAGYLLFNPKGDLKDKDGKDYYYWTDGSIRDRLQTSTPADTLTPILKRDYTYETALKDSVSYTKSCLTLPLSIGFNFHFGAKWTTNIGLNYTLAFGDYLDNKKSGSNDAFYGLTVGIQYEFKKEKKSANPKADFNLVDNLDVDKDSVPDIKDNCLGTPHGVKVDTHGCPFDQDGDGVPDYLDKEKNTKKGAKIDGYGATINEDEMAKRQLEWDAQAQVRSTGFNESPSLNYLKEIESKGKELNQGNQSKIPPEYRSADYNGDGYISANEITKTIDNFFEGTNDYTVEKINKLIDFFFEQ